MPVDRIIFVLAEIRACFSGKAIERHGGSHLCISVGMGGAWSLTSGDYIMKVNIEIDCRPEEARQFIELLDVSSSQTEMIDGLRKKIAGSARNIDPETLMKGWLSGAAPGMESFQKMFEPNLSGGARPEKPTPGKD
jgi:hypothetical protein